ncbi:maltose permease MAL31 [Trichoderma evansii]
MPETKDISGVDLGYDNPDPKQNGSDMNHIELREEEQLGHLANQEDHNTGIFDSLKKYPRACAWCVYACWTTTLVSFDNQAAGSVLGIPQFRKDFGSEYKGNYVLPTPWQSAFNAAPVASAIVGVLGAAAIADLIGRKLTLICALVVSFAAISLEFAATTNPVFFGGKFLNGFAIGTIQAVMTSYIGEITPLAWRGIFTVCIGVAFGLGPLVAFIVVNFTGDLNSRWAYRVVFCCQFGFAAISTILVPFMPESPWWLVSKGRREQALKNLNKLGYKGEMGVTRLAAIELTLEEIKAETEGVTYIECFRRSNLRRTMISIGPLIVQVLTGITFVAGYFTYYLQLAGYSTQESFRIQIAQPVLSIIGNLMAAALVDRVGRRNLTFYGLVILVVLLFLEGGLATGGSPGEIKGTVALILIYSWMYNLTIGSTAFSILTETSTSRLRVKTIAIGLALQNSINVMWQFVLPYMFNPDRGNLGGKVAFVFGAPSFICLLYLWFFQPETAGRTYEELDEMFTKQIPARKFKTFRTEAQIKGEEGLTSVSELQKRDI